MPVLDTNQSTTIRMVDFYEFQDPYNEIAGKPKFARSYINIPSAVLEFDLARFQKWYKPFDFFESLPQLEEELWVFRIVMLFPHMYGRNNEGNDKTRPKDELSNQFTKYREMVLRYYNKEFKGLYEYIEQIVRTDPTIMLLGYKKRSTDPSQVALCTKGNDGIIIAAVTFRPESFIEPGGAFITYLVVSGDNGTAPLWLGSWRRQGFASFMLVHVIKFCASRRPEKVDKDTKFKGPVTGKPLSLFLQCSQEESTFQFYIGLGFIHVNKDSKDDGIGKLPQAFWFSFSNPDDCAFHHFDGTPDPDSSEEEVASRLMMLPPGALKVRETSVVVNTDKDNETSSLSDLEKKTWCRFPMYLPTIPRSKTILSCTEMDNMILEDLDLLKKLCPPCQSKKLPLLPPKKMYVHGDMMLDTRIEHTKSMGKHWLQTFSLDMMLAMLLRDGRYETCTTVIPCQLIPNIRAAFEAHQRLKRMQEILLENKHLTEAQQNELVDSALSLSPPQIRLKQQDTMDYVIKHVILRNPAMLEKGIIVIPGNLSEHHWIATIVYNAGHIQNQSPDQPRAGFFRYDSFEPSGWKAQPTSGGVVWLLNLAHSYWNHRNQVPPPATGMVWMEPFGSSDVPDLVGTETFPSLRLRPTSVTLPKQTDGYNCGVAVVVAIGIILRDSGAEYQFERLSKILRVTSESNQSTLCDPKEREYVHYLPDDMFGKLPNVPEGSNYLSLMKEEFFVAFDRLAKCQHMTLRARHKQILPEGRIEEFRDILESLRAWPPEISKAGGGTAMSNPPTRKRRTIVSTESQIASPKRRSKMRKTKGATESNSTHATMSHGNTIDLVSEPSTSKRTTRSTRSTIMPPTQVASILPKPVLPDEVKKMPPNANTIDLVSEPSTSKRTTRSTRSTIMPATKVASNLSKPVLPDEDRKMPPSQAASILSKPVLPDEDRKMPPTKVASTLAKPVLPDEDRKMPPTQASVPTKESVKPSPPPPFNKKKQPVKKPRRRLPEPEDTLDNKSPVKTQEVLIPGNNVWKYLVELDKRRSAYKAKGKTFLPQTSRIEELIQGDKPDKGYADSDSECSINTQQATLSKDDNLVIAKEPLTPKLQIESVEHFRGKYGFTRLRGGEDSGLRHLDVVDAKEMAEFVEKSFVQWGWSNNETHLRDIAQYSEIYDTLEDPRTKKLYRLLINAMKQERKKFRKQFENEFLFTRRGFVKGIRFRPQSQDFVARIEYKARDPETKEMVVNTMTCPVSERWMRDEFPPEVLEHVVNMTSEEDGFITVPEGVSFQILDKKIIRVRYQPSQVRKILDAEKVREMGEAALRNQRLKRKRQGKAEDQSKNDLPKKEITTQPRWVVKFEDDTTMVVAEEVVRGEFGDLFTEELKSLKCGYVDVPVGNSKISRLSMNPELVCLHPPRVFYTQSPGRDLCVSKALASVLHQLGFVSEAEKINLYGEQCLVGGTVDALKKVFAYAVTTLPTFIQGRELPRHFDWKTMVCDDLTTILLGAIFASDGSISHAIAIHGGFIYDANETVAIPLTQEALDYCSSTETVKSTFVGFWRGYTFAYNGKKPSRIAKMTLHI